MLAKLSLLPLLSAVVSASPLLGAGAPVAGLEERDVGVTSNDLSNFEYYFQMVAATACNSDGVPGNWLVCGENACPQVMTNQAKMIGIIYGSTSGLQGFIATDPVRKNIVISIRGSSNIRNWITNLQFALDDCDFVDGCKVHSGFAKAWAEVRDSVLSTVAAAKAANPSYTIIATGHSLGAAVATIGGADLRRSGYAVDIYTYGSPRVGNGAFADFVTNQPGAEYRVTHVDDPVPRLPPIFLNYRHTSPEYWLSTGGAKTVDYTVSDIKVCTGNSNTDCNGGTFGLDVDAHIYYFGSASACKDDHTNGLFSTSGNNASDAELAAQLTAWAKQDIAYSKSLEMA